MSLSKPKTLVSFELDGYVYEFKGNNFGKEQILIDGKVVFERRSFKPKSTLVFESPRHGEVEFSFRQSMTDTLVDYRLTAQGEVLAEGQHDCSDQLPKWLRDASEAQRNDDAASVEVPGAEEPVLSQAAEQPVNQTAQGKPRSKFSLIALGGLALKLSKSAGAMKAALAGTALAGWSWLFNVEFALAIIISLLIHEYGHVWAMKRAGLKVKGVYLIPFLGGVAVSERFQTRWQEFKIAIAGPFIGTLGAIVAWLLWLQTGHDFFALLTALGLLINLFNLLPIVPLDGGQVVKAAVFSLQSSTAKFAMLGLNIVLVIAAFYFDFTLLGFFGIIGVIDLAFASRSDKISHAPMSSTGILLTIGSYLGLIAALVWLSVEMAATGVPGTDLPKVFLQS